MTNTSLSLATALEFTYALQSGAAAVGSSGHKPLPITCPTCRSAKIRRSKRRTLMDYLLSAAGILPWRCESCELRFQSRPVPFRFSLYAHCSYCGNADLQRISPEHVPGWTAFFGRLTGLPSLRCDPCRHKFFSMRPLMPQEHLAVPTAE